MNFEPRRPEPPPIAADDKDWTWVLQQSCPECGFDPTAVDPRTVGAQVAAAVPRWQAVLARDDASVRPAPGVWSVLEYGCHTRDVFEIFAGRVRLMLNADEPTFANWDQDETAVADRYFDQDPHVVADQLAAAGTDIAALFDGLADDQRPRRGLRSNGSRFTVDSIGVYFLHDVVHHLHDVAG